MCFLRISFHLTFVRTSVGGSPVLGTLVFFLGSWIGGHKVFSRSNGQCPILCRATLPVVHVGQSYKTTIDLGKGRNAKSKYTWAMSSVYQTSEKPNATIPIHFKDLDNRDRPVDSTCPVTTKSHEQATTPGSNVNRDLGTGSLPLSNHFHSIVTVIQIALS